MSHPNPAHDRDNEYPSDNYKPVSEKTAKSKALRSRIDNPIKKALRGVFGGLYNAKEQRRAAKKGKAYQLKHF